MSQGELVNAYLDGQISRRTLVRRLVALGVSFGAAVAYAHALKPDRATAGNSDNDHYPDTTVRMVSEDIGKILDQMKLIFKVRADEDAELSPLTIRCWHKVGSNYTEIGSKTFNSFNGPKTKNLAVPLNSNATGLDAYEKAKIFTRWIGHDQQGKMPNGGFVSTIKQ